MDLNRCEHGNQQPCQECDTRSARDAAALGEFRPTNQQLKQKAMDTKDRIITKQARELAAWRDKWARLRASLGPPRRDKDLGPYDEGKSDMLNAVLDKMDALDREDTP